MTAYSPTWDYTLRAASYDLRADYAEQTVASVLAAIPLQRVSDVVDIGAGTGKLTKLLAKAGLTVTAIEPNEAMLARGRENLSAAGARVSWVRSHAENTGLAASCFDAAFFGSSFNVVTPELALDEVYRILKPSGELVMLWNHRDLGDPLQMEVERRIRVLVPSYRYGARRDDPSSSVCQSRMFARRAELSFDHMHESSAADWLAAWSSHATLADQAGERLPEVISAIGDAIAGQPHIRIPYRTRIWIYRKAV